MRRSVRALALGSLIAALTLFSAPAEALCTGNCGGTPECPECVFSAFFNYRCVSRTCRWCAVWECNVALPGSQPDGRLAALLVSEPAAAEERQCSARTLSAVTHEQGIRVARLEARL